MPVSGHQDANEDNLLYHHGRCVGVSRTDSPLRSGNGFIVLNDIPFFLAPPSYQSKNTCGSATGPKISDWRPTSW